MSRTLRWVWSKSEPHRADAGGNAPSRTEAHDGATEQLESGLHVRRRRDSRTCAQLPALAHLRRRRSRRRRADAGAEVRAVARPRARRPLPSVEDAALARHRPPAEARCTVTSMTVTVAILAA